MVLTVAVGGVLSPPDVPRVVDGQEPLRATVQLAKAHVAILHVVRVSGAVLVFGAVHDGGQLLWSAVTAGQVHAAEQEDGVQVESRQCSVKVPCQHPSVHYTSLLWGSLKHILKSKT